MRLESVADVSLPCLCVAGPWEGQDVSVTVTFEPESVNAVTDMLTITGGVHGEYKCNLKGVAKAPGPQVI